jgi:GAF domain-containing protein
LAQEQAALRRVATLVAGEVAPDALFAAVAEEVGQLLGVELANMGRYESDGTVTLLGSWGPAAGGLPVGARLTLGGKNLATLVFESGRPARIDYEDASGSIAGLARERGIRSSVGTPIVVEGRLWGVMSVGSSEEPGLPAETQARLASFTELVATAIANAESRAGLARLAEEQAALRRVATLVAGGSTPEHLFAAVIEEVGRLLPVEMAMMGRYESGGTLLAVATWGRSERFPVGTRRTLGGQNLGTIVFKTGRPARVDDYARSSSGHLGDAVRGSGIRSSVATPIIVEGHLWGLIAAGSIREQPLPTDTEARLGSFTELVATAIADAEVRAGLAELADEQAALRRVAMLVADGSSPEEVFDAVAEEVGRLLGVELANLCRFEPDGSATFLATWGRGGKRFPVGTHLPLGGQNVATVVSETGRPARIENYDDATGALGAAVRDAGVRSAVGTPITAEGRLWGMIAVGSSQEQPLPPDTEARLASFTDLVATAIANTESRSGLFRLAEEQAALRRVATLVARGVTPEEVFTAVVEEVGGLLPVDVANLGRYEPGGVITNLAAWSRAGDPLPENGVRSSVDTPIIVEGRLWGVIGAGSRAQQPLPAGTEARLDSFTALVATAIANAESRAALAASRARIVGAVDRSRRRIERDLHEGAQQRLVHAVIALKLALRAFATGDTDRTQLVAEALQHAEQANAELRELAHGILPAALTRGGLRAGVDAIVSRTSLPVSVDVSVGRMPAGVEATAYFVISEALTNAVQHARAASATVTAAVERGELRVEVCDDGIGGAQTGARSGLEGLEDRVSALDGSLLVDSPAGGGTRVCAVLPVPDRLPTTAPRASGF